MKVEDNVTNKSKTSTDNSQEFSISLGGPLYRFYIRAGLLKPPIDLLPRRIIAIVLVTWFPLLLLTLIEGRAFGGVDVPFLQHIAVHIRANCPTNANYDSAGTNSRSRFEDASLI